jgi:hypothetical protein
MGLLDKLGSKPVKSEAQLGFSKKEIEFLLAKLRTATYKGEEFEAFYNIWVKLSNELEKNN